ncbi:Transcriptional regulator [Seminavis robusta]|uniref:Transcriptional regulator n=1 Tax=Seminavis robusta TaxID=568900 RepID=A0A9N8DD76_9STRA|nr:Transcriptional regulator [Seminavis robusta]|eukprot:Sro93_g048500.1 Transcriptional regulator (1032) ;mRNA; r:63163-66258
MGSTRLTSKICGRELQQQQLYEAYRRRNDPMPSPQEIVLLTGPSGSGKTVLAKSLARRTEAERGYFCWGKCDQMQHCNEPFAPFNAAVTQLVETILRRDDTGEETERLEEAIEKATKDTELGVTLLCGIFSVFRKVLFCESQDRSARFLGDSSKSNGHNVQHHHNHHSGSSAESPAIVLFCNFLREFCCIQHPVVLLLDDWQWLDQSSLELLMVLGAPENNLPGLMILGTCRGNEVSPHDPLSVVLRGLEEQNVQITNIELQGLSVDGVQAMISDLLHLPSSATDKQESFRSLAQMVHELTGGNPFFIQQNLRVLRDRKLVYQTKDGSWLWNEEEFDATGDEYERTRMLDAEIRRLGDSSLAMEETLIVASFLGASFCQKHLELVANSDREGIRNAVHVLVNDGVFQQQEAVLQENESINCYYRWRHDKYQQASSALVPAETRREYSVNVGRKLLAKLAPNDLEEDAYLVANMFLQDLSILVDSRERIQVSRLLRMAGIRAASSSAFESAVSFFSQGISLLPEKPWLNEYDLCLALHNGAIEMEFCTGRFQQSDQLFEIVIQNTKGLEDQLRAYEAKISSLSARHLDLEAVQLGFKVLKRLGEPFPRRAIKLHTVIRIAKTVLWLRRTSTETILKTHPMQRWDKLAALRLLQMIGSAVIRGKPEYGALWAIRGVEISIKYGFSGMTPPTVFALAMILGTTVLGMTEDAKRVAQIAHMIDQRYHAPEYTCRMLMFEYGYVQCWHSPFRSCVEPQVTGMKAGLLSGDVEIAFCHAAFYCLHGFCTGIRLQEHVSAMAEQYKEFSKLKQKMPFVGLGLELGKRLLEGNETDSALYGAFCDKETDLDEAKWGRKDKSLLVLSCFCQLFLSVYTNDYSYGLRVSRRLRHLPVGEIYGPMLVVQVQFLLGMANVLAAHAGRKKPRSAGLRALKKLKALNRNMTWKENVLNKIYLLEAERAVLIGDRETASSKFDSAIQYAEESGFVHEMALAHERLAFAFSQWGLEEEAQTNRTQSAILYQQWGFDRKGADLTMKEK